MYVSCHAYNSAQEIITATTVKMKVRVKLMEVKLYQKLS